MGIVLGRFRKKRTTIEVLEELDASIKELEMRRLNSEQRHRIVIGRLMLYSVGTYVMAAFVFYFFFFPASLSEQIFYITPLLVFPLIVVVVRRGIAWYFRRQITRSQSRLVEMEKKKQEILEMVMDTETYKTAKKILEKFAPRKELALATLPPSLTSQSKSSSFLKPPPLPPRLQKSENLQESELRHRIVPKERQSQPPQQKPPQQQQERQQQQQTLPRPPATFPQMLSSTNAPRPLSQLTLPLPRPVAPRERTVVDRLVDFLIADGPSNRYALICRQCASHNGMALKEEFEYVSFRCCYCFTMNPARKQRVSAPRLEGTPPPVAASGDVSGEGPASLSPSSTDSDELLSEADTEATGSGSVDEDEREDLCRPPAPPPLPEKPSENEPAVIEAEVEADNGASNEGEDSSPKPIPPLAT